MENERRRAQRLKKVLYIQYHGEGEPIWDTASVKDISEIGSSFIANRLLALQELILVRMRLPSLPNNWMEIKAKVIACADSNSGTYLVRIEFFEISDSDKAAIREYVLKQGGAK